MNKSLSIAVKLQLHTYFKFQQYEKKILILLAILSIIITGCSKDEFSDKPAQERIVGKWILDSVVTETIKPSAPAEITTEYGEEGNYFDFRTDRNLYYTLGGSDEQAEPYSIENETTLKINNDAFTIKELTEHKLVFEFVKVNTTYTRKQTYNLSR
ncbi:hypothetical protein [Chryseobacterium populi]|uniref:Lipocalin-like domain-containing protein n=1 Tax=Chryseobacterium populi TaxID=1144316 RepID=J2SSE5_9FLAO|nr:hypothetical protein [Chryseobacterium populi]EJL68502.1 hypothetical protein PMI13_03656 [Chryseobacterium populi]